MTRSEKNHTMDYVEFEVTDLERSKAFYGRAFDFKFTDYGPNYCAFTDGRLDGGFSTLGEPRPAGGPLIVIYADALEATQQRVEDAGGRIVKPIFSFPGGRRFHFEDPGGYQLAVWSNH